MNLSFTITLFVMLLVISVEGKKIGRSRSSSSGRGSSKKAPAPAPTSFSYPQPSAPKPSLFGWQERPAQKTKPSQDRHSYPSSGTGLSGDKPKQTPTNHESIQRSSASNNLASQQARPNNQQGHSYPSSTGLSGSPGSGYPQQTPNKSPQQTGTALSGNTGNSKSGYPQSPGSGLSGSGQAGHSYPQGSGLSGNAASGSNYPQQHGSSVSGNGQVQNGYQQSSGGAGYPQAPPPYSGYKPGDTNRPINGQNNYGNNYHHPQGPPPPYSNVGGYGGAGGGYGGVGGGYGGFGGHGGYGPGYGSQMPGYFGNYGKGGVSRPGVGTLAGVGLAGAGVGTVLTGLALWNLARSTGHHHHTVIYDNRGQPVAVAPANDTAPAVDSILADLVNCSLTISNDDKTEVLAIPCAIATSFTPEADVKDAGINENKNDSTKCTVTVLTKTGKEFMTTIPCSILLNSAAENNVTEPVLIDEPANLGNTTSEVDILKDGGMVNNATSSEPTALKLVGGETDVNSSAYQNLNCTIQPEETRDPINPCYSVTHNLTVVPLPATEIPT